MSELRSQAKTCQMNDGKLTVILEGHCHPLTRGNINITAQALRSLEGWLKKFLGALVFKSNYYYYFKNAANADPEKLMSLKSNCMIPQWPNQVSVVMLRATSLLKVPI